MIDVNSKTLAYVISYLLEYCSNHTDSYCLVASSFYASWYLIGQQTSLCEYDFSLDLCVIFDQNGNLTLSFRLFEQRSSLVLTTLSGLMRFRNSRR